MSKQSDLAKIETINKYINDLDLIISHHKNIENALEETEGQYAIFMCLFQIGETLNKISDDKYYSLLPIKEAVGMRNIIAHNYDGIDFLLAKKIINDDIPELKKKINHILQNEKEPLK